jgi:hypothetical protein
MTITLERNYLLVQRGDDPRRAKRSGWSNHDGWGMEHHFMFMVKRALAGLYGAKLVKVNAAHDGHLMDDRLPILRPPRKLAKSERNADWNVCIFDPNYMLRSAAQAYNDGEVVHLAIERPYFTDWEA